MTEHDRLDTDLIITLWPSCMSRVALNPGLGGVRDLASAIITHEQTQQNRVCCFQTLDAVIPKDLLSDYLETPTAVVVQCGGPQTSPRTSI